MNSGNGHSEKGFRKVCCVCPWTQLFLSFSKASCAVDDDDDDIQVYFISKRRTLERRNEKNKFWSSLSGVFKNSHMSSILWFKSECLPRRYWGQNQYSLFWIKISFFHTFLCLRADRGERNHKVGDFYLKAFSILGGCGRGKWKCRKVAESMISCRWVLKWKWFLRTLQRFLVP